MKITPREKLVLLQYILLGIGSTFLTVVMVSKFGLPATLAEKVKTDLIYNDHSTLTVEQVRILTNSIESEKDQEFNESIPTLVVFEDPQCPFCRDAEPELHEMLQNTKLNFVVEEIPSPTHPIALFAAKLEIVAKENNKFAEFHNALFRAPNLRKASLLKLAKSFGLDSNLIPEEINSPLTIKNLSESVKLAGTL